MKKLMFFFFIIVNLFACSKKIKPPVTKKIPYAERHFGIMLKDNYHWLKDKTRKNKDVIQHLKEENAYANAVLKPVRPLQKGIYREILSRIPKVDTTVYVKIDSFFYYKKTYKNLEYPRYFRKLNKPGAKEECYFDENLLAKGKEFFSVSTFVLSPNQSMLAITVDTTGAENYVMQILNLKTKKFLKDYAYKVSDIVWLNNTTLYYTIDNNANRTYRLYKHKLGDNYKNDKLIYQENDPLYYLWIYKTRSKRFIIMGVNSKNSSEIRFLDVKHPEKGFSLIEPRRDNVEYYVDDYKNNFIIQTNADNAINNKIMIAPISNPQKKNWKVLIPENDSIKISVDVFEKFMVLKQRKDGLVKFLIKPFNMNQKEFYIDFPEPTYSAYSVSNPDYYTHYFRYGYESMISPYSIYELDINTGKTKLLKQSKIINFDKSLYKTERIFATAKDGTKIPISIVYKKDLFKKNGTMPLLLYGYGAYGDSEDPYFSRSRLSILDRGFIYAIAHVRGGGEYGKKWYDEGKMLKKKNTFTDFIACAEHLISEGYTSSKHLYIEGASAGGLLIGAVLNMRPDLFAGAFADVPFVDVLNTMLDPTLTSTTSEYKEWGNPNIKIYFDYIRSYCPYQNVKEQNYPPIFVTAGFYDTRVNYWEPTKWVAKLREYKKDNNKIIFLTEMNEGHMGASGNLSFLNEIAREYAYLIYLDKKAN